jgi:uncharacterized protein (TIGR03032 family)
MAASARRGRRRLSFFPLPHPSGIAVDPVGRRVVVASTRNPNQVFVFRPALPLAERAARPGGGRPPRPLLLPAGSTFYPGSLYIHDLALVDGRLYANAVGRNAVVRLAPDGDYEPSWWPRCIERRGRPVFSRNHIQLNSIAAGPTLQDSFFSASSTRLDRRRPGHLNYPVDGHGVIFSGRTREPVCSGLTRPHSARLHEGRVWVANSGYGELGFVDRTRFEVAARRPGWTRGLCIVGGVAFVGTSRVISRFARYAPGLDQTRSRCAVHAVSVETGAVLGSLEWPFGNQIFGIEAMSSEDSEGFPFTVRSPRRAAETALFYHYRPAPIPGGT